MPCHRGTCSSVLCHSLGSSGVPPGRRDPARRVGWDATSVRKWVMCVRTGSPAASLSEYNKCLVVRVLGVTGPGLRHSSGRQERGVTRVPGNPGRRHRSGIVPGHHRPEPSRHCSDWAGPVGPVVRVRTPVPGPRRRERTCVPSGPPTVSVLLPRVTPNGQCGSGAQTVTDVPLPSVPWGSSPMSPPETTPVGPGVP